VNKNAQLGRARGYRVDTHDGRIGGVAAVLPRAGRGGTGVLLVQTGLLCCRLVSVPFDEVEKVDERSQRILLESAPETIQEGAPTGARRRILTRA
jgi:hypothetical protein